MTKDEYIVWKPLFDAAMDKGEPWPDNSKLREADKLIKATTLENARVWVRSNVSDFMIREYLLTMIRCHFGSAETDQLLQNMNAYPEWM